MKPNFLRHTALCGLFIGLILVLLGVLDLYFGFYNTNTYFTLLSYAVMAGGIIWGALQFRNKESEGFMTYGQVVGYGVLAAVCFGIIAAIFHILLVTVIEPTYVDCWEALSTEQLSDRATTGAFTEQQIDLELKMIEFSARAMRSPLLSFFSSLFSTVLVGLIISLIAGIFIQRKRPSTPFDTVR